MNEDKTITPEWLESKGFVLVTGHNRNDLYVLDFDYPVNDGDLFYVEKELDRKMFAIILTPYEDEDGHYDFTVLIREDVGCGFCPIPNQFCEMTEYYFSLLYEAIRRIKL